MALIHEFDKNTLEETTCPLCEKNSTESIVSYTQYEYVKCSDCGLIYLNPRLNEVTLTEYYSREDFYNQYSDGSGYEVQEKALRKTFRKFLTQLKARGLTGGKLLEVGCGFGYLLDEAKEYFAYRVGTDYSNKAVEHAKKYADEVYCGGIDSLPNDLKDFDVVINFAVMEHVYYPKDFVKEVNERMKNNSCIIIATPNAGDVWYKLLKDKWPFFIPPEHVCLYDRFTLRTLFESGGYKDIQAFDTIHAWPVSVFLSKMGMGKIGDFLARFNLGKLPIPVSKTIICVSAKKV